MQIFSWINRMHPCMYRGLTDALTRLQSQSRDKVDLMVVDATTVAGFDAADTFGIPYVVNNAGTVEIIRFGLCWFCLISLAVDQAIFALVL